jgi:DNA helicase II / ATP-dependent DNA helicase PcrA
MDDLPRERILADLNPGQREAVMHGAGPQLVVAGAGTGKTTVLTKRVAYLVASKVCSAKEILALTFTDKAAAEMESRVDLLVPYGYTDSTLCTFHAFGERVLREQGFLLGLSPDYRVLSGPEQLVFLRERLFDLPLAKLRPLGDPTKHLEIMLGNISRAKDEDVSPEAYRAFCAQRLQGAPSEEEKARWEKHAEMAEIYSRYQTWMTEAGYVDFGDLIVGTLALFRSHPDVLSEFRQRFTYLLVDEFQDTNLAQFELIRLLAGEAANLTAVGDDDQSIYKFRGAAISNILQFTRLYPQAQVRVLTENYRSGQAILDTAYRLIRHNDPERLETLHGLDKRLVSVHGAGEPVTFHAFETVSAEADWIAGRIQERQAAGHPWRDFCILVRSNQQADPFMRALNLRGIPFRFSGSQGLYRRPEVKLCLAFLRAVADPANSLAWHELAVSDLYQLPAEDLARLLAQSQRSHRPLRAGLEAALEGGEAQGLSPAGRAAGEKMLADLKRYTDLARRLPTGQVLYRFLSETGLLAQYTQSNTVEADFAIKNLAKFFNLAQRFEGLAPLDRVIYFVRHLDMLQDAGDDPALAEPDEELEAVGIFTVHRAKGLEFPFVFLAGLAANRFPSVARQTALAFPPEMAKEELSLHDPHLAEERRLCYVGLTRAQDELVLTQARDYGGKRLYKVSRFVLEALELPPSLAQTRNAPSTGAEQIHTHAPLPEEKLKGRGPLAAGEMLTLSYYQINDFLTCPLKYKYIHLLKIPVLPHHAVIYGNALHAAIQAFYRQRLKDNTALPEAEVLEVFKKAWVNEGFISREHEEIRFQAGLSTLRRLLQKEHLIPSKPKYIEKAFSYTLGLNKIVGRIDRVDILPNGQAVIIDYKSTEVLNQADADQKAKESLQLKIYAAAWLRTEGALPNRLELHFLDSDKKGKVTFTGEEIHDTEENIIAVAGEIRQQDFTAKPSAWNCGYCPYRTICPEAET